jgi:hypothetical protein
MELPDDTGKPEVIVSAALYLMSTYGCSGGCTRLAHVILCHLEALSRRADVAPVVRATASQLAEQWERKLAGMLPTESRRDNVVPLGARLRNLLH